MSAVTAPHDDVDASNPNHHRIDTESPCRQLVTTPASVSDGSEFDHCGISVDPGPTWEYNFVRECGAAFVRPRATLRCRKFGKRGSRLLDNSQLISQHSYLRQHDSYRQCVSVNVFLWGRRPLVLKILLLSVGARAHSVPRGPKLFGIPPRRSWMFWLRLVFYLGVD